MFAAFEPVSEGRIRESVGLWFQDFAPGQLFHHRPGITMTQDENANEALATLNQAALHYDLNYAGATEFGAPVVVSTLTLQRAVGMGWKTFGRRRQILAFASIRMTAPVLAGDTLYAQTRILAVADDPGDPDCGVVTCETTVTKADRQIAAIVAFDQAIWRRGRGPFAALGY